MPDKPHTPGPAPQPPADHRQEDQHPATQAKAKAKAEMDSGVMQGLTALDTTIRTQLQIPGPPGSGLYMLLDNLAVGTLGCSRTPYPTGTTPPATQDAAAPRSDPNFGPGVPGTSPPGPLPGAGRGQAPNAASSAPLGPNA